jgi:hypothetical protein
MCAIRLNWMADLAYDQARAGKTKGTPVFRRGLRRRVAVLRRIKTMKCGVCDGRRYDRIRMQFRSESDYRFAIKVRLKI